MARLLGPSFIVDQLRRYLPMFTDLFSVKVGVVTTVIGSGNVVTVTTNTPHGLIVGSSVMVPQGKVRTPISDAVDGSLDTLVRFITDEDHDLTAFSAPNRLETWEFGESVELGGFAGVDVRWNGVQLLDPESGVPNRRSFEAVFPDGLIITPVLTGGEFLLEERQIGLSGIWEVTSVPDTTTLVFKANTDDDEFPPLPEGDADIDVIVSGVRIAAASNYNRAKEVYTKQNSNDAWLFVIMMDRDASKDRRSDNDSIASHSINDDRRLLILQNFETAVIIPTHKDLSGAEAQEISYTELFSALLSSVYGWRSGEDQFTVTYADDGPLEEYDTTFYGHGYTWQVPAHVTFELGFMPTDNVAFRNVDFAFNPFDSDEDVPAITAEINLDDEES